MSWLEQIARTLYRDIIRAGRTDADICVELTGGNSALWAGDGAQSCTALVDARARAWYLASVTLVSAVYMLRIVNFVTHIVMLRLFSAWTYRAHDTLSIAR